MTTVNIALENVSKRYGDVHALDDVSLRAAAGERLALVGHNGAGKTTLLKLLLAIIRPDRGTIRVLGDAPDRARARGAIGFLPETIAFDPAMRGIEVLRFCARLKRLPREAAGDALERVGLGGVATRRVGSYSKGMRQRLGLGQAILGDPALLLLDEPTTGLDPAFRRVFYEIVRQRAAAGSTVVISSHALSELEGETDRIAILGRGRLLATGALDEVRRQARLPVRLRITTRHCQTRAVAAVIPAPVAIEQADGETLALACDPEAKMAVLRALALLGDQVRDIEVLPPSLDAIYARVTEEAAQ